jgi:electron transport complex protein RnfC
VLASTNCVLVLETGQVQRHAPQMPCIRCGECARVCPAQLLPQTLHQYLRADDQERARQHGLQDCIECGCCDLVCPSHIPLVQQFRWGKQHQRECQRELVQSDAARARFEARQSRLEREAAARAERQAMQRARGATANAVQDALRRASERQRNQDDA